MNTTSLTKTQHELVAVTAERDHWKANHDNRVKAAKILTDRTDMPLERVGAYKHYVAALEANQKLRDALIAAETELAKLLEQEPVAYLDYWKSDGTGIVRKQRTTGVPFFNHPIPAPAATAVIVLTPFMLDDDTRRNDEEFAAQQAATAPSVPELEKQLKGAISSRDFYRRRCLLLQEWQSKMRDPERTIVCDILANGHTLPPDHAGDRYTAPSVPEEWRAVMAELAADLQAACDAEHPHRDQYPSVMRKYHNDMRIVERARALLQSANHSEHVLEMVAPDCRNCANRGRVNGLSQESYCDSCIYQGRDWRENHFVGASKMVDTAKRRCEACAILPCSCK